MDRTNPIYVPRNQLVEDALAAAVAGDLAPYERLVDAVTDPFEVRSGLERYALPVAAGRRAVPHVLRDLSLPSREERR